MLYIHHNLICNGLGLLFCHCISQYSYYFYPPCRSGNWCFQVMLVITITHNIIYLPLYYLLDHHIVHWKFCIWYNIVFWYMYMIYYQNGLCIRNLGNIYSAALPNICFTWVWSISLSLSLFLGGCCLEEILNKYLGLTRTLFSLTLILEL